MHKLTGGARAKMEYHEYWRWIASGFCVLREFDKQILRGSCLQSEERTKQLKVNVAVKQKLFY